MNSFWAVMICAGVIFGGLALFISFRHLEEIRELKDRPTADLRDVNSRIDALATDMGRRNTTQHELESRIKALERMANRLYQVGIPAPSTVPWRIGDVPYWAPTHFLPPGFTITSINTTNTPGDTA